MKSKEFKEKILLITYGIILFVLLYNYQWIFNLVSFLGKILMPFIVGAIIAFILNVVVKMLEEKPLKKMKKYKRVLSTILALVMVFGFLIVLLTILIPQIKNAGTIFVDNLPQYKDNIYEVGNKLGLSKSVLEVIDLQDINMDKIIDFFKNNSDQIIKISMGFASSVVSAICNLFIGIVFAIYILMDKEHLTKQFKKLLKSVFKAKTFKKICEVSELSNITFTNFVKVQVLEATILGLLCFIGMMLFRLPYAATISVLVGVTALIPVFGAFVGCGVGAFLIFMINPLQSLTFIIFFLVLQQIEGNFIYPRVVGGKIGLPSIWVLVAVTVGGSVGGVFGMLLGVPVISIVYSLLRVFVTNKTNEN